MSQHPHRLSDPATAQSVDAIVGLETSRPGKVLCVDRVVGDLELNGGSSKTGPEKLEPKGTRGKERLSDKYLAGLLDADGSIMLKWTPKACIYVSFAQKNPGIEFLRVVASSLTPPSLPEVWGHFQIIPDSGTAEWRVGGSRAISILMRIKRYLVIKRAIAECAIEINGKPRSTDIEARFASTKGASPMPKHPTRKWVAGFLDGDGTFNIVLPGDGRWACQPTVMVMVPKWERVAVDLLAKAYGGSQQERVTPNGCEMVVWTLYLDPPKLRSIFESEKGGIAKHMVLKTDQIYFLLGCARMGHYRDGARIRDGLHALRIQPHRLSGPGADVAKLLATVRDIPSFMGPGALQRKRQWESANADMTDYEGEIN